MTMNPTNKMMKDQGLGSLSVRAFRSVSKYLLIESFDCCLVESFFNWVSIFLIFSRSSIFSQSNTFLVSNSESLINLRYANFSLIVSILPWVDAVSMLLSVGFQISSLFAILVAKRTFLCLPTLSVCRGVCLRSTSSERSDSRACIFQAPDHSDRQCRRSKKRRRRYQYSEQRWGLEAHAQQHWNGTDTWRDWNNKWEVSVSQIY